MKAFLFISVHVDGIEIDLIIVDEKASVPMLVRLLVPVSSPVVLRTPQCWKACSPIVSIDDGMLMVLSDSQKAKARSSISVRLLPSIVTFVRAEPQKACFPMYSTFLGIVIVVSELQLLKAYVSIFVTLSGIVISLRLGQLLNALSGIVVSFEESVTLVIDAPESTLSPSVSTESGIVIVSLFSTYLKI